jgi:proline iminopeptidase
MADFNFREVPTNEAFLATYSCGQGPALILLHGGPGDTHHYLRPLVETLSERYTCILYDQRGTGRSPLPRRDAASLALPRFVDDLHAVARAYELTQPLVLGHSWGAILALHAALADPSFAGKTALISLGPLNDQYGHAHNEALLTHFNDKERAQWAEWRAERRKALSLGDSVSVQLLDNRMMRLRVKSWVARPELRESFLNAYFADPPVDRQVNTLVWESLPHEFDFDGLSRIHAPVWICQGEEDANPLEQLRRLERALPAATTFVIPDCGHIPWIDAPLSFLQGLRSFLGEPF